MLILWKGHAAAVYNPGTREGRASEAGVLDILSVMHFYREKPHSGKRAGVPKTFGS